MNKQLLEKAIQVLNEVELEIFRTMVAQEGVPFLKGRPGTAKSAILRSIADKLNMEFIDLRLPTMDETDLGVFPVVRQKGDYPVLAHAVPEWAEMTTDRTKNFLICFEELNRADKPQRNAALGLLNERIIGHSFKFGDNVYMAATGNIGSAEDGADVEEFDTALKSRLIPIHHDLDYTAWKTMFANDNVHPDIIRYLDEKPTDFYPALKDQGQDTDVFVNPRTWTRLSYAIIANFGKGADIDTYGQWLLKSGKYYVGSRAQKLYSFLNENKRLKLSDVLSGRKKDYSKVLRDNRAEVLEELVGKTIASYKKTQFNNVVKFLESFRGVDSDLLTGKMVDWLTKEHEELQKTIKDKDEVNNKILAETNVKILLDTFKPEFLAAQKHLEPDEKG